MAISAAKIAVALSGTVQHEEEAVCRIAEFIAKGEGTGVLAITGPEGSGKSSLAVMLPGLLGRPVVTITADSTSNVAQALERAIEERPDAVIIIDEVHEVDGDKEVRTLRSILGRRSGDLDTGHTHLVESVVSLLIDQADHEGVAIEHIEPACVAKVAWAINRLFLDGGLAGSLRRMAGERWATVKVVPEGDHIALVGDRRFTGNPRNILVVLVGTELPAALTDPCDEIVGLLGESKVSAGGEDEEVRRNIPLHWSDQGNGSLITPDELLHPLRAEKEAERQVRAITGGKPYFTRREYRPDR